MTFRGCRSTGRCRGAQGLRYVDLEHVIDVHHLLPGRGGADVAPCGLYLLHDLHVAPAPCPQTPASPAGASRRWTPATRGLSPTPQTPPHTPRDPDKQPHEASTKSDKAAAEDAMNPSEGYICSVCWELHRGFLFVQKKGNKTPKSEQPPYVRGLKIKSLFRCLKVA